MPEFDMGQSGTVTRLVAAMEDSREKLQPFREARMRALTQYSGFHYSDTSNNQRVPVNLLEMATTIYMTQLAARAPTIMVNTPYQQLQSQASDLELAIKQAIHEVKLEDTMRAIVFDALHAVGIAKVGLNPSGQVELNGRWHDVGKPFVDRIDLDDWVHDMQARTWEEVAFCGHRYRTPYHLAMEGGMFDEAARNHLQPSPYEAFNEEGDERPQSLSQGEEGEPEELYDYLDLWDIYIPESNLVVTFQDRHTEPLRIVEWEGPENGPFHLLRFQEVPNNVMPLPPAALWMDLHELENVLYRKLWRQAERQKTNLGYRSQAAEDAERIKKSADGDIILMDQPESAKEVRYGGIDQLNFAFALHVRSLFTTQAGNLDALGGLGPQSETLGQDQLLNANASKRVEAMQDRVMAFTQRVIEHVAWYEWTDPIRERRLAKKIPEVGIEIPITWSASTREGDFLDYNFELAPYSMQQQSPATKLQTLMQVFQGFIAPMMPMLEAQGITVNFKELLHTISRYANLQELENILTFFDGDTGAGGGPIGEPPRASPVTHRTNERISRSGTTPSGDSQVLMQQLLGGDMQAGQMGATSRGVA